MPLSAVLAAMRVSGATKESREPEIARRDCARCCAARANGIHAGCVQGCEGLGPPAQVGTSAASIRSPGPKAGRPGRASSRGHRNDLSAPAASAACATTSSNVVGPFDARAIECASPTPSAARVTCLALPAVTCPGGLHPPPLEPPPPAEATAALVPSAARLTCPPPAAPLAPRGARRGCGAGHFGPTTDFETAPPRPAEPLPVLSLTADSAAFSPERRESTPIAFRLGLALLLVALGFGAGRLTAPGSNASVPLVARSAPPPTTAPTSVAVAATLAPLPALAPLPPASALQGAPPSLSRDLEPPAAPSVVTRATSAPALGADSQALRKTGMASAPPVASARSAEAESTSAVLPSATTRPVNSFVQAVHDDIAEDEASHKKP